MTPNIGHIIAQFCYYYPGEFQHGHILWRYFWFLHQQINHLVTFEQVTASTSIAMGAGIAFGNEGASNHLQRMSHNILL